MKVVFSRKGFDSASGGIPNPILPDGTMLSLPIPSPRDDIRYDELFWKGVSFYEIIRSLSPGTRIQPTTTCHLDPDLRKGVLQREEWIPAFGQIGSSLMHLFNQGVSIGDLFLFFGWYRQTEFRNGQLRFVPNAPDLHVIYGYLQVGTIIKDQQDLPLELFHHPHAADFRWETGRNALFLPTETFSLNTALPGFGCLDYDKKRVLTKPGGKRRLWDLPAFFRDIPISYNRNAWKADGFRSAGRGQEFVFEPTAEALGWVKGIVE